MSLVVDYKNGSITTANDEENEHKEENVTEIDETKQEELEEDGEEDEIEEEEEDDAAAEELGQANHDYVGNNNDDDVVAAVSMPPEEESKPKQVKKAMLPCSKCRKRHARRGCIENACITCCSSSTSNNNNNNNCPAHREAREKLLWKQQVLEGTTRVNQMAQEMRQRVLRTNQFRESGFCYLGDTVLIWSLNEFGKHTVWKEEAIRKAERRNRYHPAHQRRHQQRQSPPPLKNAAAIASTTNTASQDGAISSPPSNGVESRRNEIIRLKKRKFHQIMEKLHQQHQSLR